jgi:hypothetical protein
MGVDEFDRKVLLVLVVGAGATALTASLGGLLVGSGVWIVGPVLGIGAIVSFVFFLRTRPARRRIVVASVGMALGVLSVAIPAALLCVFALAGD